MFCKKSYLFLCLLGGVAFMQVGCSISYSLEKSSDSVSTSLDSLTSLTSISTSSSSGEEEGKVAAMGSLYEEDVAAVTVLYVSRDKNNNTEYQRRIAYIAKRHGISDWEQEESTFLAMGRGLRRAGVSEESITELPFFRSITEGTHYSTVLSAYNM